jgi:hypothetical protein
MGEEPLRVLDQQPHAVLAVGLRKEETLLLEGARGALAG